MMKPQHAVALGMASGLVLSVVLAITMVATGNTFGQRCAVHFEKRTDGWKDCISRLQAGKPLVVLQGKPDPGSASDQQNWPVTIQI